MVDAVSVAGSSAPQPYLHGKVPAEGGIHHVQGSEEAQQCTASARAASDAVGRPTQEQQANGEQLSPASATGEEHVSSSKGVEEHCCRVQQLLWMSTRQLLAAILFQFYPCCPGSHLREGSSKQPRLRH